MGEAIRLILIDDHWMVRKGLQNCLELDGLITVVGEASDAEEGLAVVAKTPCDVAVVDLSLPVRDGIWLTQQLKSLHPDLPVLVLTMHIEDRLVIDALRAGANGYVLKSAPYEELCKAINAVKGNGFYINHRQAKAVVEELKQPKGALPGTLGTSLTDRECSILQAAAEGLSNKDIGERFSVSESTVKSHLRTIYRKLDVPDRTQAIVTGLRLGIVRETGVDQNSKV